MRAGQFAGSGAGLTGVPWSSITGAPTTLLTLPFYAQDSVSSGSSSSFWIRRPYVGQSGSVLRAQADIGALGGAAIHAVMSAPGSLGYGVLSETDAPSASILGKNTSTGINAIGVQGEVTSFGTAVVGLASATTGEATAGRFELNTPSGTGVIIKAIQGTNWKTGLQTEINGGDVTGIYLKSHSDFGGQAIGLDASIKSSGAVKGGFFRAESTQSACFGLTVEARGPNSIGVEAGGNSFTGPAIGGRFSTYSNGGTGLIGQSLSGSPNGFGVIGSSESSNGIGVSGHSAGIDGYGVFGSSTGSLGVGVYGIAPATSSVPMATIGVKGESSAQGGTGVFALSTDLASGTGVKVRVSGQTGVGIDVQMTRAFGNHTAGTFRTVSSGGTAILAENSATTGATRSLISSVASPNGTAILGDATSLTGMPYGLAGQAPSNGFAVFAFGRSGASGTKSFVIDDPRDPDNKMLIHYSHEGPEPQNVYNGSIITDEEGCATVRLPDYFHDINTTPRIQLTVVDEGEDFVMVKVARKLKGNQFSIRTSKSHTEVYWEVKAIRNDPYVQRNGYPVELEKPDAVKGKYFDPASYGLPESRGMSFRERAAPAVADTRTQQPSQGAAPIRQPRLNGGKSALQRGGAPRSRLSVQHDAARL